jgi:hypothetical protein
MVNLKDIDIEAPLSAVFVAHNYGFAVFYYIISSISRLNICKHSYAIRTITCILCYGKRWTSSEINIWSTAP